MSSFGEVLEFNPSLLTPRVDVLLSRVFYFGGVSLTSTASVSVENFFSTVLKSASVTTPNIALSNRLNPDLRLLEL